MTRRTIVAVAGVAVAAAVLGWILLVALPGWARRGDLQTTEGTGPTGPPSGAATAAERKITATLYYVADDGMSLIPAQREVTFGEPVVEQARFIIEAQLAPVQAPLASAVPAGTKLRALYVTENGEAFVDLSPEITSKHPGGALEELFTVYTIVNALTVNLPAITHVQILVDGKEADTLAGHVDLRQPLTKNLTWVKTDNPS
jgi:spore germination protein GerM